MLRWPGLAVKERAEGCGAAPARGTPRGSGVPGGRIYPIGAGQVLSKSDKSPEFLLPKGIAARWSLGRLSVGRPSGYEGERLECDLKRANSPLGSSRRGHHRF